MKTRYKIKTDLSQVKPYQVIDTLGGSDSACYRVRADAVQIRNEMNRRDRAGFSDPTDPNSPKGATMGNSAPVVDAPTQLMAVPANWRQ